MKLFLNKTWAKVTAFLLFFVFLALSVAGGLGIAYLASNDYYSQNDDTNRVAIYHNQAANIAETVFDGLMTFNDEEQFITWISQVFPAESGYGITLYVGEDSGRTLLTSLPDDAKIVYNYRETHTVEGKDLTIAVDLQEGFLPYTDGYRLGLWLLDIKNTIIPLTVLFIVLTLFFFFWQMASAGHWPGYDGIHLTWFDKIPLDLMAAVFLLPIIHVAESWHIYGFVVAVAVLAVNLVYLFIITFVTRCKAGTLLKNTVIWRAVKLLWKTIKNACRWIGHLVRSVPLVWKTVLGIAAVLIFSIIFYPLYPLPMLLLYLVLALFALYVAAGLSTLRRGSGALAEGDYSKPVDTRYLRGDLLRCGESLNKVQQGVQRAVEERLRSERMKTELITNVSHDIKTPLTSIVNYVDLLEKEEIDNPKAQEYLEVLDRQSKRLKKLTEDLVEASKASSGVMPVDCQPTNVNVLLSQLEGEYEERMQKADLTMIVHPAAGDPVVLADGKLLSRVMDNLMNNIGKYAMPGTRVYAAAAADEAEATISIKNVSRNELNISAEELMERFVRGDSSRHTEGSGLGLSIARSLVELQGGRFELSIDGDLFRADISLPLYHPL